MVFRRHNSRVASLAASAAARILRVSCVMACALLLSAPLHAQTADEGPPPDPVFVPPDIGTPADRAGAGTRDVAQSAGALRLLVPKDGGLTTFATPPLVWELPSGFRGTIRYSIITLEGKGVVFEQVGAFPKGLYGLDLRRSELRLSPNVIYRWTVELVQNDSPVARSVALIERVPSDGRDAATAGLWFDVLDGLVTIDLSSRVRVFDRAALDALLRAGGLAP